MPSTIYNEGRVVGYSAYEIYVRHVLSEDPNHTPASELEWLSSSIAMGSSMLLKISAESASVSGHHALKIILPNATNLVAANTIIGSLFLGDAECDARGWATKVTSYGPLLDNNSITTMGTHINTIIEPPIYPHDPLSSIYQDRILNYIKLVDGIVVQPGEWKDSTDLPTPPDIYPNPKHDLLPRFDFKDNGSVPYVRLYLSDRVTEDFYILLTGFTINGVINGVSGLDGSTDTSTNMHENGGFLGPAVFPWANKIIFSVPPAYANYFLDVRYSRALQNKRTSTSPESFGTSEDVRAVSVIDMESGNPNSYYQSTGSAYIRYDSLTSEPADWFTAYTRYYEKNQNDEYVPISGSSAPTWAQDTYYQKVSPCIGVEVTDCNKTTGDSILTVYQRNDVLPPALYASKVSATGEYELNPVDTIAPGTVKLYENDTNGVKAKALEDEIPGNYALMRDTSDYVVKELDDNQNTIPVAETSIVDSSSDSTLAAALAKSVQNTTGKKTSKSLSMTDANGNAYSVQEPAIDPSDPTATTISPASGNIHWETLLKALAGNKSIDIFSTIRFLDEFYRAAKARLLAGAGISFADNDAVNVRTRTISTKVNSAKGMACNTDGLYANFLPGSGINFVDTTDSQGNPAKLISNSLVGGELPQLTPTTHYTVDFDTNSKCCGNFINPSTVYVGKDRAVTIRYSPSIDGSPANIYVGAGTTLGVTSFSRSSITDPITQTTTYSGFWFRHAYSDRDEASRMLRITFTSAGLQKLGIPSGYHISRIYDTSTSSTGIWNVVPKEDVTVGGITYHANDQCGESWNAICVVEKESTTNNQIYVVGVSYADGYNVQIGTRTGIAPEKLFSNHINLSVSCQLFPVADT